MFLELFQFDFINRALIAGIIISIIAPLIGIFLVIKRYSLITDTLSHTALAGVAIGLATNSSPILITIIVSIISSVLIEKIRNFKKYPSESILTLFLSGSIALTAILSSKIGFGIDLFSFLFGSISTVQNSDILLIGIIGAVVALLVFFLKKELFLISFDEELAKSGGINTKNINFLFIIITALVIALSIRIVGTLLIGSLMIIPVMSAMHFGKSFKKTIGLSIVFSILSVILGLLSSFYFDLASGGSIISVAIIIFITTFLLRKK